MIMTKQFQLGELADIQSGYGFRGRIENVDNGKLGVIQARDVKGINIEEGDLIRINKDYDKARLYQQNDVVLTARGSFRAGVGKFKHPTIVSSSLFVIRLTTNKFLVEYIAIYLNSETAQYYINQNAKGATIQSISIDDLKNLSIPYISLENQRVIIDLQQNVEQQNNLLRRKQTIINNILKSSVTQTIEGATK